MAKFDYMEFSNGNIVFNADKYNFEQARKKAIEEFDFPDTVSVIGEAWCRYYPKTPEELQFDLGNDGCYRLCPKGRGSFRVLVAYC